MHDDGIWAVLSSIDGVEESDSAFKNGAALWVNGMEIAHWDSDSVLDLRLTRAVIGSRRGELRADSRVRLRASSSDWIEVEVRSGEHEPFVVDLVKQAVAAHRPPKGAMPRPVPTGKDLERQRRSH